MSSRSVPTLWPPRRTGPIVVRTSAARGARHQLLDQHDEIVQTFEPQLTRYNSRSSTSCTSQPASTPRPPPPDPGAQNHPQKCGTSGTPSTATDDARRRPLRPRPRRSRTRRKLLPRPRPTRHPRRTALPARDGPTRARSAESLRRRRRPRTHLRTDRTSQGAADQQELALHTPLRIRQITPSPISTAPTSTPAPFTRT